MWCIQLIFGHSRTRHSPRLFRKRDLLKEIIITKEFVGKDNHNFDDNEMTTTLTMTEILKVFVISFIRAIVIKILARTTLPVKVGLMKKVISVCVLLDLRIHIVEQVD